MSSSVKTFLFISVALNALLVGLMLGAVSHFYMPWNPSALYAYGHHCEPANPLSRLPAEKRKLYETTVNKIWSDMNVAHTEILKEKEKSLQLIKAEPFNEAAYNAQIKHLNDLHNQMKTRMAEALVRLAKESSAAERAVLAELMSHPAGEMVGSNPTCPVKDAEKPKQP